MCGEVEYVQWIGWMGGGAGLLNWDGMGWDEGRRDGMGCDGNRGEGWRGIPTSLMKPHHVLNLFKPSTHPPMRVGCAAWFRARHLRKSRADSAP